MKTIDSSPVKYRHGVAAGVSAAVLAVIAVAYLPLADEPWEDYYWFRAIHLACTFLLGALISLFLALQVLAGAPTRMLAWLSGGYAFTAMSALMLFLTAPDILTSPVVGSAGESVGASLWTLWHAGFPCFVLMAVGAKFKPEERAGLRYMPRRFVNLFPVAIGIAAALGGGALLIRYPDVETMVAPDGYVAGGVGGALLALSVFALATLISRTRLRATFCLWLAVALFAFMLDVLMSLAAAGSYNAGWYIGRGLSLASSAALMVALLIEHFNLHRDAEVRAAFHEQEAMHDPLTGVFNRRYLMRQLTEELGRAKRYRHPVSVLLMDLDHFKRINDRFGHPAGDDCLRAFSHVLGERVHRHGDFSARYGGEEFVMVLPETGLEGAVDVAEEIRDRIETLHERGLAPCPMTTSIGVATANSSSEVSSEDVLAEADRCLYRAKQQGRNRVVWTSKHSSLYNADIAPA